MRRSVGLSGENERVEMGNNAIEEKTMASRNMERFVILFFARVLGSTVTVETAELVIQV